MRIIALRKINRFLLASLLFTFICAFNYNVNAQTQKICTEQLTQAEEHYNRGRFNEAINLITECLDKPEISSVEKKQAYRLLGLAYLAKDYLEEARNTVRKLLEMVPNYESDPVQDPPQFTKLIDEVKQEELEKPEEPVAKKVEQKIDKSVTPKSAKVVDAESKGGSKKWYFIGGGVLVAGGITAAILLSKDENGNGESSFPLPPNRP